MNKEIVLVAAVAYDRVIGNKGRIPWWDDRELRSEDMKHFRELTLGKPVIMGHATYLSIGKLLSDRTNIILSREQFLRIPGASVCNDLDSALYVAHTFHPEAHVIGGEQVYRDAMKHATRLEMTEIEGRYEGDTFFPQYKETGVWEEVASQPQKGFAFVTYQRRNPNV